MKVALVSLFMLGLFCIDCAAQVSVGAVTMNKQDYGYQYYIHEGRISPLVIYPKSDSSQCSLTLGSPKHGEFYRVVIAGKDYFFPALTLVYYESSLGAVVILDEKWMKLGNGETDRAQIDATIQNAFARLKSFLSRAKSRPRLE